MPRSAACLTDTDIDNVLSRLPERNYTRNLTLILLTHHTGMRAAEIAALKVKDVTNADGTIRNSLVTIFTKGNRRTVFLSDKIREELRWYLKAYKPTSMDSPLFAGRCGEHMSPNGMVHLIKRLYLAAGYDNASSHSGRRSLITKLHRKGIALKTIMTVVGHKHLSTTERYISTSDEECSFAVNLI